MLAGAVRLRSCRKSGRMKSLHCLSMRVEATPAGEDLSASLRRPISSSHSHSRPLK